MNALIRRTVAGSCLALIALCAAAADKRPLEADDFDRLLSIDEPVCSRDGGWIAFAVIVNGGPGRKHIPNETAMRAAQSDLEDILARD